ncbi:MAG: HigA family addiction module antitoxin [Flavobacteriaceae bacterium]|nr:HigA family addiction module antitoxin [Flavobacteriaceae bacterium]
MSKLQEELEFLSKPGDAIRETIEYIKMTQVELAKRMDKTPAKVNDLISGKEPVTLLTAVKLERVLGIDAEFWLNMETFYRNKLERLNRQLNSKKLIQWLKLQPLKELKNLGYLKTVRIGSEMVEECFKFYGVTNDKQWKMLYANQYRSTNFRKSEAYDVSVGSIAAFLRIGEIEMRKMNLQSFDRKKFKEVLKEAQKLVKTHPEDFPKTLKKLCFDAGVALVYTPKFPKAPISGVARWLGGSPLIQLTDRYQSNDQFWFTFFHEAGHILLHGRKNVFIEKFGKKSVDSKKEIQANNFAKKWLLPRDIKKERIGKITADEICRVAQKHDTHPAIVLGRLQHDGIVPYSYGNHSRVKVDLDEYITRY